MMKPAPRSAFEVIQAQIVFGALEVLFDVPARATELEAAGSCGEAMEVGQVVVIGFGLTFRPIHHQPNLFQFSLTLPQAMLQIHLAPSQTGTTRLAVGGLPRAAFPLLWRKAGRDLRQAQSGRDALGQI